MNSEKANFCHMILAQYYARANSHMKTKLISNLIRDFFQDNTDRNGVILSDILVVVAVAFQSLIESPRF